MKILGSSIQKFEIVGQNFKLLPTKIDTLIIGLPHIISSAHLEIIFFLIIKKLYF